MSRYDSSGGTGDHFKASGSLRSGLERRAFSSPGPGALRSRTLLELLLAATLTGAAYYLVIYVPKHLRAGEPVLTLGNYFLTYAPIQGANHIAYVVPDSLGVWDTPAVIRTRDATLKSGEQVRALGHFGTGPVCAPSMAITAGLRKTGS